MRSAKALSFLLHVGGEGHLLLAVTIHFENAVSQVPKSDHEEQRAEGVPETVPYH
jgi:hypothetical protein